MVMTMNKVTKNVKSKIEKNYLYEDFGFPVIIPSVKLINYKDEWLPQIDILELELNVAKSLNETHVRFTGNHIRFIRSFLNQSLRDFAKSLGMSHVAVKKWEGSGDRAAAMAYPIEFFIRFLLRESIRRKERKHLDSTEVFMNQFIGSAAESNDHSYGDSDIIYAKYA